MTALAVPCPRRTRVTEYTPWEQLILMYHACSTKDIKKSLKKLGITRYERAPGNFGSGDFTRRDLLYTLVKYYHQYKMLDVAKQKLNQNIRERNKRYEEIMAQKQNRNKNKNKITVSNVEAPSLSLGSLSLGSLSLNLDGVDFEEDNDNDYSVQPVIIQQEYERKQHQHPMPEEENENEFEEWWQTWSQDNPVPNYDSDCCRTIHDQNEECKGGHTTKANCEANGRCIWGILNRMSIRNEINFGTHMIPHNIGHFDKQEMWKHHFIRTDRTFKINQILAESNVYEPGFDGFNHYFAYDRCGNYIKIRLDESNYIAPDPNEVMNLQLHHLNLIKHATSSLAANARYPAHTELNDNIYGALIGPNTFGSATLIAGDRILSCTHNAAVIADSRRYIDPEGFWSRDEAMKHWGLIHLKMFGFYQHDRALLTNPPRITVASPPESTRGISIDWILFDMGGATAFSHDIMIAKLKTNYPIPAHPIPAHNLLSIFPFGFEQYGTGQYKSIGMIYDNLIIDIEDEGVAFVNQKKRQYREHGKQPSPNCKSGTLKVETIGEYLQSHGHGTSGQSGSLCIDAQYTRHQLNNPFINGLYTGSLPDVTDNTEKLGHVTRFDLIKFIMICDSLNNIERQTQCQPVFNDVITLLRGAPPFCNNNDNQFLWKDNMLKCILDINDEIIGHCSAKNGREPISANPIRIEPFTLNVNIHYLMIHHYNNGKMVIE